MQSKGFTHLLSPAHTPEFNGFEERFHRTVGEMDQCMRAYASLPKTFWGLSWEAAVYILNRLPTSGVPDDKTPCEILFGRTPDLSFMRIFGSPCCAHVPKKVRRDKLDYRSVDCIFVGYDEPKRCYKLVGASTSKMIYSKDVIFLRNLS